MKVTFNFWHLVESLISLGIGIGLVYFFAWLTGDTADNTVGWVALGLAAGSLTR